MDLRDLVPVVHRARGYRLYSSEGKRWLDFWQNGGLALLGHRPEKYSRDVKNSVSRGLFADYPNPLLGRLEKALLGLFPDYAAVRIYRTAARAAAAVSERLGRSFILEEALDPLFTTEEEALRSTDAALWRPFLDSGRAPVLLPRLPVFSEIAPIVVCFRELPSADFHLSDPIPAPTAAGLLRIVRDLTLFLKETDPRLWEPFSSLSFARRRGPYLIHTAQPDVFTDLFRDLLSRGLLLSPDPAGFSVIPAEYSEGEVKPLKRYGLSGNLPRAS